MKVLSLSILPINKDILLSLLLIFTSQVTAEEFEMGFLQGNHQSSSELLKNLNSRYIPGSYWVTVYINKKQIGQQSLVISNSDRNSLCLTSAWLDSLNSNINLKSYQNTYDAARQCYRIGEGESTTIVFNPNLLKLDINIPQANILKPKVEPVNWDYGTSAIKLNYNINTNYQQGKWDTYFSSQNTFNIKGWTTNADLYYSKGSASFTPSFSLSRPVESLQADLTLGQISAGSSQALGLTLASNSAMTGNDIGYKPIFSGVTHSYARVSLLQNGTTLYSEMMPPGPFSISTVTLLTSGDVTMKIEESSGEVKITEIPVVVSSSMLSPGQRDYSLSVGLRQNSDKSTLRGAFTELRYNHGFNSFSLNTETLIHPQYVSLSLGSSFALSYFGSLSLSGDYSYAKYFDSQSRTGMRAKATYSKNLTQSTSFNVSATVPITQNFVSFGAFNPTNYKLSSEEALRNTYTAYIQQSITSSINMGLNGYYYTFWDKRPPKVGLSLSNSFSFKWFSLNLGYSYSQSGDTKGYDVSASLSIPFSIGDKKFSTSNSMSYSDRGEMTTNNSLSSSLTSSIGYSVATAQNYPRGDRQYAIQVGYSGDTVLTSLALQNSQDSITGSASLRGGVLYLPTEGEYVFAPSIGSSVAFVKVPNTEGVKFSAAVTKTDSDGNTLVNLSGYSANNIFLDASSLPFDTEILSTSKKVTPADNSVLYIPFSKMDVHRYVLQVRDTNDKLCGAGVWAFTKEGIPLGFTISQCVLAFSTSSPLTDISMGSCTISKESIKDTSKLQEVRCEP